MLSPTAADAAAFPPAAAVVDSCCWVDPTADAAVAAVAAAAPLHLFYSTFTCVDPDPQSS